MTDLATLKEIEARYELDVPALADKQPLLTEIFSHQMLRDTPYVVSRSVTCFDPAQLLRLAEEAQLAAKVLQERIRDANRAAAEADAELDAQNAEDETEAARRFAG